jgi:uncharacterized protein
MAIGLSILLLLFLYSIIAATVYWLQERLVFRPYLLLPDFQYIFHHPYEEFWLSAKGGARLNALLFRAKPAPKGVVLYLHGNRGNLEGWAVYYADFIPFGYDFLAFDYRGFGKSTGEPSEAGLYDDAEAAYLWLKERYAESQIVVYGRSLGSAVASWLGSRYQPRAVVLETPYDNIPNVIRAQVGLPLPASLFRLHFRNDYYLQKLNCPAYIFAGTDDLVVPFRLALRLRPLLPSPEHFIVLRGGDHRNLATFPEYRLHLERILA